MSFPFDVEDLEIETEEEEEETPREYEIDFSTGELTGRIVEGLDAIKVWIYLALRVPRYRHVIYSWDYGNELETLVGQGYTQDHLELEVNRMLEEALLINENILSIDNLEVTQESDKISVSFTANTLYGEVDVNV